MNYSRGALKVNAFVNRLDGDATNLLAVGPDGQPLPFLFKNTTFDVEASDVKTWRGRHVFSYGGNVRYNAFDLSLAPRGDSRTETGGYAQDEIFLSDQFRWVVGARLDKFSSIDHAVFSPRTTFMYKPAPAHTFRVSYNRAYRAPSHVNNYLETTIVNQLDLGSLVPALAGRVYNFPVAAIGNADLEEESLNAYEIGYSGVIANRATVSAAFYVNDTEELDLLHPDRVLPRQQPAAELAAAAGGARADLRLGPLRPGQRAASGVQLRELRQGAAEGDRARRRHGDHARSSAPT